MSETRQQLYRLDLPPGGSVWLGAVVAGTGHRVVGRQGKPTASAAIDRTGEDVIVTPGHDLEVRVSVSEENVLSVTWERVTVSEEVR